MAYDEKSLRRIYDRTHGKCHVCGRKLSLKNYASEGNRGAWEVEHSVPKAKGGTDHMNNLYPAHITCNREKGTVSSQTARRRQGRSRAPLSKKRKEEIKNENAAKCAVFGGLLGLIGLPFGPAGVLIGIASGAGLGALIGHSIDPE